MKKSFTYTVLQYRHSLVLKEAINVGILFLFPEDKVIRYVSGNSNRIKSLYTDFDPTVYSYIIKNIQNKVSIEYDDLFSDLNSDRIKRNIHKSLLREDDTALQFLEPKTEIYPFKEIDKIISEYTSLLLPGHEDRKTALNKHNEQFILKTFTHYLFEKNKSLENTISRNKVIQANGLKLKFDISWVNGTTNLVKPLSFDLKEEQDIQNKSVTYFGYLTKLKDYAELNKYRFDLLVWKPQERKLYKEYTKALDILNSALAPKRIVQDKELKDYSEETIEYLIKHQENQGESTLGSFSDDPF